jgi:hypothetical protein
MPFTLVYHPHVKTKDIPPLNRDIGKRIQRAIESRLTPSRKDMASLSGERSKVIGSYAAETIA